MKERILKILKYILIILFTITSLVLIFSIYKLNILYMLYFIIIFVIIGLLNSLIIIKLLSNKSKTITKWILSIISIMLLVLYFISIKYVDKTIDFINNITNIDYEIQSYSVVVLKSSNYNEIYDLNNTNIGFIDDNKVVNNVSKKLKSKIKFYNKNYEELGSLISSLVEGKTEGSVINSTYLDIFKENNEESYENLKVIYTFNVLTKKEKTNESVNIKKDPFIIYISGSDSNINIKAVARSDVNMIAVVNPNINKILLVSTPRDYYVQLHGTTGTKDKLTHAGVYGIDMSKSTMEDLLDINVNYYVKVSFSTLIKIVDVIDGIDIYSDATFTAKANKNCKIELGKQHLDGACALAFARERYAYTSGDRHRGENQQAVITAIINKLNNPKYLKRYSDILESVSGSFETDMSYKEITNFAKYQLSNLKSWDVESISLDGSGAMLPTYSMGSQNLYVMIPNIDTVDNAKFHIQDILNAK